MYHTYICMYMYVCMYISPRAARGRPVSGRRPAGAAGPAPGRPACNSNNNNNKTKIIVVIVILILIVNNAYV